LLFCRDKSNIGEEVVFPLILYTYNLILSKKFTALAATHAILITSWKLVLHLAKMLRHI